MKNTKNFERDFPNNFERELPKQVRELSSDDLDQASGGAASYPFYLRFDFKMVF